MIIKYSKKSIKKHRFFTFVLILQLVCIFFALYNILFYSKEGKVLWDKINRFNNNRSFYRFVYDEEGSILEHNFGGVNNVMNLCKELDYSDEFIFNSSIRSYLFVKRFNNDKDFIYYNNIFDFGEDDKGVLVNNLVVSKNTLDLFDVKLENGRKFYDNEYYIEDDSIMPIILGNDYKDIYHVGDKILYSNDNTLDVYEAEVVGILKEGESIPIKFDMDNANNVADINSNNYSLDKIMIIPLGNRRIYMRTAELFNILYNNFLVLDKNLCEEEKKRILFEVEEKIEVTTDIKFTRKSFDKEITAEVNRYKEVNNNYKISLIIILIISTITIIVSMINLINKRKKEFAVYLLCGGRIKDIALIIMMQMLSLLFLSIIVTCITLKLYFAFMQESSYVRKIDFSIILIIMLFGIIYSFISMILPLIKVKKIKINQLLRRNE